MTPLFFLAIFILISAVCAFITRMPAQLVRRSALSMAQDKAASVGNLSRKIKRKLRTITVENFETIYTDEFDNFLKVEARGAVYENIMKLVVKKARQLKITLKPSFGLKAKVVIPDIVETATAAGCFQTLLAAAQAAGIVSILKNADTQLTLFAPNDDAFAKLPEGTVDGLLADIPKLTEVLKNHVVPGTFKSKKIAANKDKPLDNAAGKTLEIKVSRDGEVTIAGAKLEKADIKCRNGIVHIIDTVLVPA